MRGTYSSEVVIYEFGGDYAMEGSNDTPAQWSTKRSPIEFELGRNHANQQDIPCANFMYIK